MQSADTSASSPSPAGENAPTPPDERLDACWGVFAGGNRNIHRVLFRELPRIGQVNLTPFQEGDGFGAYGGFFGEIPLVPGLRLNGRFSIVQHSAQLRAGAERFLVGTNDGDIDTALFQRTMDVELANAGLQVVVGFQPIEHLSLFVGGRADFAFWKTFRQIETLLEPSYGRFENGLRTRNPQGGVLPDIRALGVANMNLAVMGGIGYELMLNAAHSLTLTPEIMYSRGLVTILQGQDITGEPYLWQTDNIHASFALRWYPARAARFDAAAYQLQQLRNLEKTIAQERANIQRELKELKASGLLVKVSDIIGIGIDGQEIASPTVRVEEFRASKTAQLLPYIFFNENSSVIPARYRRIFAVERQQFRPQILERLRPIDMYYHILNIVGKRLAENPTAKIVLVGYYAGVGAEKDNRRLARQRAESVSDYFQDIWRIASQRIDIREQSAPPPPSSANDSAAMAQFAADYRRVEIISDQPTILAPLEFETTQYIVNPPTLRFGLTINAGPGLKQWELEVSEFEGRETRTLLEASGGNSYPSTYIWNIEADEQSIPRVNGSMDIRLSITDIDNRDADAPLASVPVEVVSFADKQRAKATDPRISIITLGFFDTDPRVETILQGLQTRIKSGAVRVFVDAAEGEQRSSAIASRLGITNARSAKQQQKKSLLLKNDINFPEGRLYNHAVRIELHEQAR